MITKTSDSKQITIYMNPYDYDDLIKEIENITGNNRHSLGVLTVLKKNGIFIIRDFPKGD